MATAPADGSADKTMMIDFHTHILPGVDDGARSEEESIAMLRRQRRSGVDRICLTPHFYPGHQTLEGFLDQRTEAWERLCRSMEGESFPELRLGAEVHYSPDILQMDLRQLTLGDTDYLLLELPHGRYPAYIVQVIQKMMEEGLTPILAHVERFPYFRKDPSLLKRLIDLGALGQVSADSIHLKLDKGFAKACLGCGLAQLVGSDAHNMEDRRPCMEEVTKLPEPMIRQIETFSQCLWENEVPPMVRTTLPKKNFFGKYS